MRFGGGLTRLSRGSRVRSNEKPKSDEEKKLDELLEGGPKEEAESLPLEGEGATAPLGDAGDELADLLKKEAEKK